ncbi:MAG: hypothetical protein ACK5KQ_04745 [Anaerorhabdus sp.]
MKKNIKIGLFIASSIIVAMAFKFNFNDFKGFDFYNREVYGDEYLYQLINSKCDMTGTESVLMEVRTPYRLYNDKNELVFTGSGETLDNIELNTGMYTIKYEFEDQEKEAKIFIVPKSCEFEKEFNKAHKFK